MQRSFRVLGLAGGAILSIGILQAHPAIPIHFEPGLTKGEFQVIGHGEAVTIRASKISVRGARLQLQRANPNARMSLENRLPGESHYLAGTDAREFRTHVPQFGQLRIHDAWPGVDVLYHARNGQLEFDFLLRPGADPYSVSILADAPVE